MSVSFSALVIENAICFKQDLSCSLDMKPSREVVMCFEHGHLSPGPGSENKLL